MTVRGIEAIKLYMPPTTGKLDVNAKEEKGKSEELSSATTTSSTMNSVERYRQEWQKLLYTLDNHPECIRDWSFDGHLVNSKFRSIYWTLLLRVLNSDHRTWCMQRQEQRKCYNKLNQEFVKNPHDLGDESNDDPLSQSSQSVWNQYFSDQELFAVIRQDVVRTFPGVDFFRKDFIQNAMSNILFYYAREHPYMCYRQGMHEILAPIIFVMYGDHQSLLHFKEVAQGIDIDETLLNVLDPSYLEADSYFIFSRLMSSIESYYRVTTIATTSQQLPDNRYNNMGNNHFNNAESEANLNYTTEVEVIGQLNSIRDKILAKEDLHLHNYLLKLDIPLHIFGIRWLRLLFGREFALLDLLVLWDAIFADSDRFDLPNFIVVAMLIRIRDKLLLSDYTSCLTYLMRYPPNVDIHLVLRHALNMLNPKKYDLPNKAFNYCTGPQQNSIKTQRMPTQATNTTSHQKKNDHTHADSGPSAISKDHQKQLLNARSRSTSLGDSPTSSMERQITAMQTRNAADEAMLAKLKNNSEQNNMAMEGYKENNPDLIRLELKNAQTVIAVARNKLLAYLNTIKEHMPKQSPTEVLHAVDGIEELCQFLDVKFMFPLHARNSNAPIDQCMEANEQQSRQRKTDSPSTRNVSKMDLIPSPAAISTAAATSHTYEKPDNGFMIQSSRLLGHLKEIELIPIVSDEKFIDPLSAAVAAASISDEGIPVADPLNLKDS